MPDGGGTGKMEEEEIVMLGPWRLLVPAACASPSAA